MTGPRTGIARAAIIGGGVIGGGWLARLIENGIPCRIHDPDPEARRKLEAVLAAADRAYGKLTMTPRVARAGWELAGSAAEAAAGADLVIEAVPERLEIKRRVYAEIETVNAAGVIASSTSGILPTELQAEMANPGRLIVAHPFNPVYLLPLVELVAGAETDPAKIDWAKEVFAGLGMHPLHCRVEVPGFLSDRLQEALWREALWLLHDGAATAEELDAAIAYGPGLRWAQMGTMQTFHLAGGEGGMRAMLAMFGPCLKWPWTKLMEVPELTPEFVDRVGAQCEAQAAGLSPRELERIRDDNLVAILQALKANDWGAGRVLAAYERAQADRGAAAGTGGTGGSDDAGDAPPAGPVRTLARAVPPDWTDYNNHMNESRYLQAFCDATDALMRLIGADADYIAGGQSYFTAETHIRHLDEVAALEPITVDTQVLGGAGRKLHLFHEMRHGRDGRLLATGEHMLIHVDLATRAASLPGPAVAARLAVLAEAHAGLERPEGVGRAVGQKR
ncbi:carnitine 3-dehydrogenase [Paralimibaculum aggregatum]|uniref:Carnitine 3-dehydrogenase n=1 Tax=Paralimibaculum aggregatum TaxID=3036245 RepID=A0ABQ6LM53_9RHOB|nr:carnitine 3-dehydrogenase [Limibaculum sp. NKW23]GMG84273.1 carnitine 3-dehydrogenase [Limibaculum sp. NKW23]